MFTQGEGRLHVDGESVGGYPNKMGIKPLHILHCSRYYLKGVEWRISTVYVVCTSVQVLMTRCRLMQPHHVGYQVELGIPLCRNGLCQVQVVTLLEPACDRYSS